MIKTVLTLGLLLVISTSMNQHQFFPIFVADNNIQVKDGDLMNIVLANPEEAGQFPPQSVHGLGSKYVSQFGSARGRLKEWRSLQLSFINDSGKDVLVEHFYFKSGTWQQSWPTKIEKGYLQVATVRGKNYKLAGVAGGVRLRIQDSWYIYIGFDNPLTGPYKHFVELSWVQRTGRYGYDKCENNLPKKSTLDGFEITATHGPSPLAQQAFIFILRKV